MNGKKAKALRAQARQLATSAAPLVIRRTPQGVPFTAVYPANHYRRIYQDLKRAA